MLNHNENLIAAGKAFTAALIVAFLATLANGAEAQLPKSTLWEDELVPCDGALANAERLNGPQLFRSARDCAEHGKEADAVFLQIAGQIRSQTDMVLLRPRTDQDEVAMSQLAIALYSLGGAGPRQLYSDNVAASQLFQRLEAWHPVLLPAYDPGWKFRESDRHTRYESVAEEIKQARLAQLKDYAALAADPHYAALETKIDEIQTRHPQGLTPDSEDYERFTELLEELNTIAENRAHHQKALADRQSVIASLPSDLEDGVAQIFTGYNGPDTAFTWVFTSEQEVADSWLARALTPEELVAVLSQVNFDEKVLVVHSLGRLSSATGTVYFSKVSYNAIYQSWSVAVRVGVRDNTCAEEQSADSYPFAIAVAPKPSGPTTGNSLSRSNFADGCKPPIAAETTSL
jgi:hypothetical protein